MKAMLPDGTVIFAKILAVTSVNKEYRSGQWNPYQFHVWLENSGDSMELGGSDYDTVQKLHNEVIAIAEKLSDQGWVA